MWSREASGCKLCVKPEAGWDHQGRGEEGEKKQSRDLALGNFK